MNVHAEIRAFDEADAASRKVLEQANAEFLVRLALEDPKQAADLGPRFVRLIGLGHLLRPKAKPKPSLKEVLAKYNVHEVGPTEPRPGLKILIEVAKKHDLTILQLKARRRLKRIVRARQEAMYRLYSETTMSLPQIGRFLGGFDHTTVLHGCCVHAERNGLPPIVTNERAH